MTDLSPQPPEPAETKSLPSRRERLRALVRLRSQRRVLVTALATATGAAGLLGAFSLYDASQPDVVPLGRGKASVETMPVTQFAAADTRQGNRPSPVPSPSASSMGSGEASYYGHGDGFAGRRTANGEVFDPQRLTAAHRTLPMGSRVRVTNPSNGESVVVRINDRGPFHGNRVIDLSYAAAREIGLIRAGRGNVRLALLT